MDPFVADIDDDDEQQHQQQPIRDPLDSSQHIPTSSAANVIRPTSHPRELSATPSASLTLATTESGPGQASQRSAASGPSQSMRMSQLSSHTARASRRSQDGERVEDAGEDGEDEEEEELPSDEEVALMSRSKRQVSSPSVGASSSSRRTASARRNLQGSGIFDRIRRQADRISSGNRTGAGSRLRTQGAVRGLSRKERALWQWANVENLDEFLLEVYAYYTGQGMWCIALSRALNLLTIAFVIGFSTFLFGCVDYSRIRHDGNLSEVIVAHCASRASNLSLLLLAVLGLFYAWQVLQFGAGLTKLWNMKAFYEELLGIPDADVQAIPWAEVVRRLGTLRASHPITSLSSSAVAGTSAGKMDAHDVANRIMRRSNYLIALFNKDVLDITVPLPGLSSRSPTLTRTLEWNLSFCLLDFVFDSRGNVRRQFTSDRYRADLIEGLKRRFIFMAVLNAVFAPFIVLYLLIFSFFRYFEEYHRNPGSLGARQYTPWAKWKFREFNELPHLFQRRCHMSYPFAQKYVDQFPKERTAIVARFVAFIAGSFTAVLLLASVIDPDLFLHFEITPQRNVLFYIGVFGAILAVSRSMIPAERLIFEPEELMTSVVEHTHYCPESWKGRFHSAETLAEFGNLYQLKVSIFLTEIVSVILTPLVLWRSLPKSAPAVVDFFREFTVHVDGLGYVCSFAVFNFARNGNVRYGAPVDGQDERLASKAGKMEQSLLGFRAANPDWQPTDPSASLFLSRLAEAGVPARGVGGRSRASGGNGSGSGGGGAGAASGASADLAFTPANSTLAARSQLYEDAFQRSISLASRPSNAAALQASAIKTGARSIARDLVGGEATSSGGGGGGSGKRKGGRLQAVDEAESDDDDDDDDEGRGALSGSSFAEADPARLINGANAAGASRSVSASRREDVAAEAGMRGLLQRVYGGGGAAGGRW